MNASGSIETTGENHVAKRDRAGRRRIILAGIAGNVMEWYDFAVYGYFAPIIGRHFFPSDDPGASLIAAFGVFAAGFLMRPLGGFVFGYIGDRIGRKAALTVSVLAMAIPTFLIGVLPGYETIGVWASLLLVLLRMVQGISVGGEYTTSVVFLVESAPTKHRGFAGSWSTAGATLGTLLGSAVGALVSTFLPPESVEMWGWRLPFVVGLFVGLAGLYIREHLPESGPAPANDGKNSQKSPIVEAVRDHWRSMIQIAALSLLNAVGFYTAFVFAVTYFEKVPHFSSKTALDINSLSMIVLVLVLPLAGALSDRVGRKPLMLAAALTVFATAWPLFWLMSQPEPWLAGLGQVGLALVIGTYCGVVPVTMVEAFPARVRCSSISIGYNLCLGLAGGTAPLVATWLMARTHDDLAPAFYLMIAALVSATAVWTLPGRLFGASTSMSPTMAPLGSVASP